MDNGVRKIAFYHSLFSLTWRKRCLLRSNFLLVYELRLKQFESFSFKTLHFLHSYPLSHLYAKRSLIFTFYIHFSVELYFTLKLLRTTMLMYNSLKGNITSCLYLTSPNDASALSKKRQNPAAVSLDLAAHHSFRVKRERKAAGRSVRNYFLAFIYGSQCVVRVCKLTPV